MEERKLSIKLLPKQIEAFTALSDDETTELLYGGSAGSGKSDFGCTWILVNALAYPGTRWLIGRSKLSQLKSTTMKTFRDVTKRYGLKLGSDWFWPNNSNEITLANGSEIILKDLFYFPSDPDFDSLGSMELTGAFIDEASQIVQKAYDVVKSRIRYKLNEFNILGRVLITCNPSKNFLYPTFYLPKKEDKLPSFRKFIKALPTDNQFLPKSYLDTLRKLDKTSYQRLYLGQWEYDDDPAALVSYEKILALFNNSHIDLPENAGTQGKDGKKYLGKWITVDPSYTGGDSTVILVWNGLKTVDYFEYSGAKVSNELTCDQISTLQSKWNVPSSNIIIDVGGGYGNAIWEAFKGSQRFLGAASSVSKQHQNLRTECFYRLAIAINDSEIWFPLNEIEVEIRVTREIEQLKRDKIDSDSKLCVVSKEKMKEGLHGKSPDFLDGLSMRMLPLLTKTEVPLFSFFVIDA